MVKPAPRGFRPTRAPLSVPVRDPSPIPDTWRFTCVPDSSSWFWQPSALRFPPPPSRRIPPIYHQIKVPAGTSSVVESLIGLGLDVNQVDPEGYALITVRDEDLDLLNRLEIPYEMMIQDAEAFYAQRLAQTAPSTMSRGFPDGSMGGFYTFSEIVGLMDQWATQYPNIVSPKQSIGQSIEGRDIWAFKVSDNPNIDENEPEVCYDALIHCREPESMMVMVYFILDIVENYGIDPELTYLVDNREIWFVLCHNPDGYVYNEQNSPNGGGMWRKNRRNNGNGTYGVDLNRNYGYKWGYDNSGSSPTPSSDLYRGTGPFSEPETQALRDFLTARPVKINWNAHTYGNYYLAPYGYANVLPPAPDWAIYQEMLDDMSADNGYTAGSIYNVLYAANGGAIDWAYAVAGSFAFTPEIGGSGDGFWPPFNRIVPLAEENYPVLKYCTWVSGSYVVLNGHDLADDSGDGLYLPGEPVEVTLTLRNKGLDDTATSVMASVSSQSPYVELMGGSTYDFGVIAGHTDANNQQNPLKVKIKSTAPYGEKIALDVSVDFDGYTQSVPVEFTVGIPQVVASLDMETDPAWTVGDTGDDATAGIWERDDPIGTSSSGQQIQPGDDHTPAPGTMCFVTGNGSSQAGGDDVDNGKTTLKTHIFDLSGAPDAVISYWRWYADLGSSPNNDVFQVDISNDGGRDLVDLRGPDHHGELVAAGGHQGKRQDHAHGHHADAVHRPGQAQRFALRGLRRRLRDQHLLVAHGPEPLAAPRRSAPR